VSGARFVVIAQGVGIAVYKRAAFIVLILVVFQFIQLTNLQTGIDRQREQSEQQEKADVEEAQKRLEQALRDNERLERQTQAYVKCIAIALIMPAADRSKEVFDKCGIEAQPNASPLVAPLSPAAMPTTQPQPKNPTSSQPTTSSPPDPDAGSQQLEVAESSQSSTTPLIDQLLSPITKVGGE
jgi:hypothetical protein